MKKSGKIAWEPWIWLALFGILNLVSSGGRWTVAPLVWIYGVFGLRFLHSQKFWRGTVLFYLVYWITTAIPWYGLTLFWGPAHYIFIAVNTLINILPYVSHRLLTPCMQKNGRPIFLTTFVLPTALVALEYLGASANPIGNFGAVGYTQFDLPIVLQVVSLTGMTGLTFLIGWFTSVIYWAWEHDWRWSQIRVGTIAHLTVLALVIAYGAVRLMTAPAMDAVDTVPIASFTQTPVNMGELNQLVEKDRTAFQERTAAIHADYLSRSVEAALAGAKIVVWPEAAGVGLAEDVEALVTEGQAIAREQNIYLAMPVLALYPDDERLGENKMYLADPAGDIVMVHVKYGGSVFEGTLAGSGELQTVETPYGTLSAVICWDTDFPSKVLQAGRRGVDILLSPSLEWEGIDPLHGEMAVFRAVENGVSVVRQADKGWSLVADPYGRILADVHWGSPDHSLFVNVPTAGTSTMYTRIGDVIVPISVVAFIGLALWAFISGRRESV
jgi:apolipoprotein N-acyltransferase